MASHVAYRLVTCGWLVSALAACTAVPVATLPSAAPTAPVQGGLPSATPGAPSSATPSQPAVTPAPSAAPGSDVPVTVRGMVMDDAGGKVEGAAMVATIIGKGSFTGGSDAVAATTVAGAYAFTGVPVGTTLLLKVSKPGLATRQRTHVTTAHQEGSFNPNVVDFGVNDDGLYAMSDKPEVVSVSPARLARGVDPATSFTLVFSEPMNKASVEDAFAIYVAGDVVQAPGVWPRLDMRSLTAGPNLIYGYLPAKDDNDKKREPTDIIPYPERYIYDGRGFLAEWSADDTTVTFRFKPGYHLPVDQDPKRIPDFAVTFKRQFVRDVAGAARDRNWFRLFPSSIGRYGYTFRPATDETQARIASVVPRNRDELAGATTQDRILIQFSKPMQIFPLNLPDRDGPGASAADTAIPDSTNDASLITSRGLYHYEVASAKPAGGATKTPLAAKLWDGDPTHATVELTPTGGGGVAGETFGTGENVWVKVDGSLRDPSGNRLESASEANVKNGFAQ